MNHLNTKETQLWNRISTILWQKWDPIGVYEDDADWNDEYDSYVPHIFRLAIEGKDYKRIAGSLTCSIRQNMGLSAEDNNEYDIEVAKLIIEAKEEILG